MTAIAAEIIKTDCNGLYLKRPVPMLCQCSRPIDNNPMKKEDIVEYPEIRHKVNYLWMKFDNGISQSYSSRYVDWIKIEKPRCCKNC